LTDSGRLTTSSEVRKQGSPVPGKNGTDETYLTSVAAILSRSFQRTDSVDGRSKFTPRLLRKQCADLARGEHEDCARLLRRQAGIQNATWGTEDFTSVNRDRAGIYLSRGSQGRGGAWVWVGVEDATKLHDDLVARGVPIRMPLTNFSWALEFHVEDPDGNVLRFGSEPLPGQTAEDLPR